MKTPGSVLFTQLPSTILLAINFLVRSLIPVAVVFSYPLVPTRFNEPSMHAPTLRLYTGPILKCNNTSSSTSNSSISNLFNKFNNSAQLPLQLLSLQLLYPPPPIPHSFSRSAAWHFRSAAAAATTAEAAAACPIFSPPLPPPSLPRGLCVRVCMSYGFLSKQRRLPPAMEDVFAAASAATTAAAVRQLPSSCSSSSSSYSRCFCSGRGRAGIYTRIGGRGYGKVGG